MMEVDESGIRIGNMIDLEEKTEHEFEELGEEKGE